MDVQVEAFISLPLVIAKMGKVAHAPTEVMQLHSQKEEFIYEKLM